MKKRGNVMRVEQSRNDREIEQDSLNITRLSSSSDAFRAQRQITEGATGAEVVDVSTALGRKLSSIPKTNEIKKSAVIQGIKALMPKTVEAVVGEIDKIKKGEVYYVTGDRGSYRDLIFQYIYDQFKKKNIELDVQYLDLDDENIIAKINSINAVTSGREEFFFVDNVISTSWPLYRGIQQMIAGRDNASLVVGIERMPFLQINEDSGKNQQQGKRLEIVAKNCGNENGIKEIVSAAAKIEVQNNQVTDDVLQKVQKTMKDTGCTPNAKAMWDLMKIKGRDNYEPIWGNGVAILGTNAVDLLDIEKCVTKLRGMRSSTSNITEAVKKEITLRKSLKAVRHDSHYNFLRAKEYVGWLKGLDDKKINEMYFFKGNALKKVLGSTVLLNNAKSALDSLNELRGNSIEKIEFMQRVYQRETDYYIVELIKEDDNSVKQVINIIIKIISNENYIYDVSFQWQSHLLYLLGKLYNELDQSAKGTIKQNINKELTDLQTRCEEAYTYCAPNSQEKYRYGFTLRTITLAHLYLGNETDSLAGLKKILKDPILRDVNNSFQIWYYNRDIQCDQAKGELEWNVPLNENVKLLPKTFKGLIDTIGRKTSAQANNSNEGSANPLDAIEGLVLMQLFTCCTLWQAYIELPENEKDRIKKEMEEQTEGQTDSPINKKLLDLLGKYKQGDLIELNRWNDKELSNYFGKMINFLGQTTSTTSGKENALLSQVELYEKFAKCRAVKRRNWLIRGVESFQCESVAEHMYNAWLIAFLFLPEAISKDDEKYYSFSDGEDVQQYNKHDIMTMLLLHDLPKGEIGDLLIHDKKDDKESSGGNEKPDECDEIMQNVVFNASFTKKNSNLRECSLWNEWKDETSLNSKIAHDINVIQSVFQYTRYLVGHNIKFDSRNSFFIKLIESMECSEQNQSEQNQKGSTKIETTIETTVGKKIYEELRTIFTKRDDESFNSDKILSLLRTNFTGRANESDT